jgi:RNA polymerase sigma-70 factor (ECF subfamily)
MSNQPARSEAFEAEVIEHLDAMFAAAIRLTRNRADAQDLVQESVARALRFHHKYKPDTYLRAWLLTIVRNTFINEYRKRCRRPQTVEWNGAEHVPNMIEDPDMGFYPEELRAKNVLELLSDDVRRAVDALPESHRLAVVMADLEDRSYKDIADALDCPLGTVMSRLHRGRRLLREALAGFAPQMAVN